MIYLLSVNHKSNLVQVYAGIKRYAVGRVGPKLKIFIGSRGPKAGSRLTAVADTNTGITICYAACVMHVEVPTGKSVCEERKKICQALGALGVNAYSKESLVLCLQLY